jgi:Zn-finger nucleic acid-binding protein
VEADHLLCPGCSGNLVVNPVEGLRHYVCASCGGTVITIAALRQLAGPFAQRIWMEEPATSPGTGQARCPFCSREMQPKAVPTGLGAVCRGCEAVWLDKDAADNLTVKSAPTDGQPTLGSEALRCPQCGAPISDSSQEECHYCGAGLHAPVKVVVLPQEIPGDWPRGSHFGRPTALGEVLSAFLHGSR